VRVISHEATPKLGIYALIDACEWYEMDVRALPGTEGFFAKGGWSPREPDGKVVMYKNLGVLADDLRVGP
jgi:hypothetical protein